MSSDYKGISTDEVGKCSLCNREISACGFPVFWKIEGQRFGIPNIKPDSLAAVAITKKHSLIICEECAKDFKLNFIVDKELTDLTHEKS